MDTRTNRNKKLQKEERKTKKNRRKKNLKKLRLFIVLIILSFIIYGLFIEPNLLIVHEIKIENNNIPTSFHGTKIVHFSDLHYGNTIKNNNINKIIDKINSLEPDIVIFTGDLIDNKYTMSAEDIKTLTESLKNINYTIGKYAVIGNHDFYKTEFNNIMYDSSFKVLKNTYDIAYNNSNNPILIYGVDDVLYGDPNIENLEKNEIKNINYKILLVHEPDYVDKIINKYNINLILSGHSHNGQVKLLGFDPIYTPEGSKKYYSPHYELNDTQLYISNGIGTSLFDFRFNSIPSINLYRLNKK